MVVYEVFESLSYYGIRSILALYLSSTVGLSSRDTTTTIHVFITLTCLFSLVNGFLSDAWLGKYRMILYMSLVYLCGATILCVTSSTSLSGLDHGLAGPFVGLLLVALGVGGINPCLSSFVGDQFRGGKEDLLSSLYHVFYLSVNIGSILSFFCVPLLRDYYGAPAAFAIPTALFFIATTVFYLGQRHYVIAEPRKNPLPELWAVYRTARAERDDAEARGDASLGRVSFLDYAKPVCGVEAVENLRAMVNVLKVFTPLPIFWALYDQQTSKWVFMAQRMDRRIGRHVFSPDQINTLNPFLLLFLIPTFESLIYPLLRRCGFRMRPLTRMGAGMLLTAASFAYAGFLQHRIDRRGDGVVPIAWMLPQYLLLSGGEVMLSVTGLEFAYGQSPAPLKSLVMALWFITAALGNILVALVSRQTFASQVQEFYFYSLVMALFFLIFVVMAWGFRYQPLGGVVDTSGDLYARRPAPRGDHPATRSSSSSSRSKKREKEKEREREKRKERERKERKERDHDEYDDEERQHILAVVKE